MYDQAYVEWGDGFREFYDLATDPHQLENRYESLSEEERTTYNAILSTTLLPASDPETYFSDPPYGRSVDAHELRLTGFAQSSRPIRFVRVQIRHMESGRFWNGNRWVNERETMVIDKRDSNSILVHWHLDLGKLGIDDGVHPIQVSARSVDTLGIAQEPSTHEFLVEHSPPETTIDAPSPDFRGRGPIEIRGTAADNNAVDSVRLTIVHQVNGRYWNGDTFQVTPTFVTVDVEASGQWSYVFPKTVGRYRVSAVAIDDLGARDPSPPTINVLLHK
jgi:hypothetical protein